MTVAPNPTIDGMPNFLSPIPLIILLLASIVFIAFIAHNVYQRRSDMGNEEICKMDCLASRYASPQEKADYFDNDTNIFREMGGRICKCNDYWKN